MALDSALYLVTKEIAMRSGVINSRYRTTDGRFILNNKDLSLVRLTSDEYINGLQGVERISQGDSQRLIAENHFQRGLGNMSDYVESNEEQEQVVDNEPTEGESEQANLETEEQVETAGEETDAEGDSENDNENNEQEETVEEE